MTYNWPESWLGTGTPHTYNVTYDAYNKADQPTQITLGAAPGLNAVTLDTSYTTGGAYNSTTTDTNGTQAGGLLTLGLADYDPKNRPRHLTSTGTSQLDRAYDFDDYTNNLTLLTASNNPDTGANGYTEYLSYDYAYDKLGNPTTITGTINGASGTTAGWCYSYDWANRLATATTALGCSTVDGVTTTADITAITGAAPYDLEYDYDVDRLTGVTATTSSGDKEATYGYPMNGTGPTATAQNHQAQAIDGDTAPALPTLGDIDYETNGSGRIEYWKPDSGTGSSTSTTTKAASPTPSPSTPTATPLTTSGIDTVHHYDADGIRIARTTDNRTTATATQTTVVYVGDVEITHTKVGSANPTITSRRTITTPGGTALAQQESATGTGGLGDMDLAPHRPPGQHPPHPRRHHRHHQPTQLLPLR